MFKFCIEIYNKKTLRYSRGSGWGAFLFNTRAASGKYGLRQLERAVFRPSPDPSVVVTLSTIQIINRSGPRIDPCGAPTDDAKGDKQS